MRGGSPAPDQLLALDVEDVAAWLLPQLAGASPNERGQNVIHFRLGEWFPGTGFGPIQVGSTGLPLADTAKRDQVKRRLEEAYGMVMTRNLIVADPSAGTSFGRLTASGEQQAARTTEPDQQRIAFELLLLVDCLTTKLDAAAQRLDRTLP